MLSSSSLPSPLQRPLNPYKLSSCLMDLVIQSVCLLAQHKFVRALHTFLAAMRQMKKRELQRTASIVVWSGQVIMTIAGDTSRPLSLRPKTIAISCLVTTITTGPTT